jgi:hypothetical protein
MASWRAVGARWAAICPGVREYTGDGIYVTVLSNPRTLTTEPRRWS